MATIKAASATGRTETKKAIHGQAVLVLQGGGALGAYQVGVYQALHEAGLEPDWVVGTSIGAINGAIIAGNPPAQRMQKLHAFWDRMEIGTAFSHAPWMDMLGNSMANATTILRGIPGFFEPNRSAILGQKAKVGIEKASYYSTVPLAETLEDLIDLDYLDSRQTRLTVGAVNANTGVMRYFDSGKEPITIDHVMASAALPPAFGAVRIDGEPYWDGGIYSNTPVEVVLEDNPRRDSTVFTIQLWNPEGPEPQSLWEINARLKDIQFSSRADSHIERQQQIHKLRHIIREMSRLMPPALRDKPEMQELCAWGCGTTMHLVRLLAPRLAGEDGMKDIDFTTRGIRTRWEAGCADAQRAIQDAPWAQPTDPRDGLVIHNYEF